MAACIVQRCYERKPLNLDHSLQHSWIFQRLAGEESILAFNSVAFIKFERREWNVRTSLIKEDYCARESLW